MIAPSRVTRYVSPPAAFALPSFVATMPPASRSTTRRKTVPGSWRASEASLDPRIRDEARARAIEIGREDVLALRDAGDARELVGRATLRARRDDLADREARARLARSWRAPQATVPPMPTTMSEADDAARDAHACATRAAAPRAFGRERDGRLARRRPDVARRPGPTRASADARPSRRVLPLGGGGVAARSRWAEACSRRRSPSRARRRARARSR